jgi:hypothetical protein
LKPSQLIPFGQVDDAYDKLHADLEFAYKRAKVLADILNIPVHESPEVTGTILGLVRGSVERIKSYFQAVDDALTCWEMVTTGNAKVDLNKLLCIEQQVAVDPAVSDSARLLQTITARECINIIDKHLSVYEAKKEIGYKFGLEI